MAGWVGRVATWYQFSAPGWGFYSFQSSSRRSLLDPGQLGCPFLHFGTLAQNLMSESGHDVASRLRVVLDPAFESSRISWMAGDFRPRCPTQAMDVSAPATSRITRKPLPAASRSAISSDIRNGGQRDANIDRVVSMPVVSQLGGNDTSVEPNQAPKQARSAIAERRKDSLRLGDDSRWTPFWLRRLTLWMFVCVFLLCAAVLLVLQRLSVSLNGFVVSGSTTHYAWTYGPTAFLTFLVAAWRQVDFYVKMSAPWMELQSIGGDKTMLAMVLVDEYISLLAYQVLFKAFRRRHWTVLTTATCQLLLQALVRY